MLELGEIVVIQQLKDEGLTIVAIAQRTGQDRKTVRKYLKLGLQVPAYGPRAPRPSLLDPFKDYVSSRLTEYPALRASRLLREIRELGYPGGYTTVKDFVLTVRPLREQGYEHRFETPPGKQAQVDFACFDVCFTSEPDQWRRIWVFTMVLGYCRYLWGRFVLRQDLPTVIRLHREAFAALGGVPSQILYDRMKTAVIGEPDDGHIVYNGRLLDMANHYGFVPKACAAYRAKTKGKVERPNGYIRDDFFMGRRFSDLADLNEQWFHWLTTVANVRCHGTTGRIVVEAFAEEQPFLLPLPAVDYHAVLRAERRISRDGMVSVDGNEYSVPDTTQVRIVEVQVTCDHVHILDEGRLVAVHEILTGRGQRVVAEGHRHNPPPGNARNPRQRAAVPPQPGQQVGRRDLAVYQQVGAALAARGGEH